MADITHGRHHTWPTSHMADITHGRHHTWPTSRMADITHGRYHTWPTSHMADITHGRHHTWPTSHMADITHARHHTFPTPHLSDTTHVRHHTCPTPHMSDNFGNHRIYLRTSDTNFNLFSHSRGHPTRNTKNTTKVDGHCDCRWPLGPECLGVVIHQNSLVFKQNLHFVISTTHGYNYVN